MTDATLTVTLWVDLGVIYVGVLVLLFRPVDKEQEWLSEPMFQTMMDRTIEQTTCSITWQWPNWQESAGPRCEATDTLGSCQSPT